MSSRLLSFSLSLNLVLLGFAGYWGGKRHSDSNDGTSIKSTSQASRPTQKSLDIASASNIVPAVPTPLRWNEIESKDYPTYVANLRKAGCPEPILRRIISADLKELYARKAFALLQDFHRDFWDIASRENVQEYFQKTLKQQVETLSKEPDALLKDILAEASRESPIRPTAIGPKSRWTDFLSRAKQEQLRQISERYEADLQAVGQSDISSEEKESQLARLRREMESDQAAILSPEEWAEYKLRQSGAAKELQQLYGVDFNENELRSVAKTLDDYHRQTETQPETDPKTLDEKLQAVLGSARFADLNRARSASYRELYEFASDFGLPSATAAEVFDLRIESEKQSNEIRADKNRSAQEKQALLDGLQDQVEQSVFNKFGAGPYQSYKAKDGRWINSLGRL